MLEDERAIIATDLIESCNHEIVVGGGEGLTSFFVPGDIDNAFRENQWSVAEMVEVLTNIVRDGTTRHIERRDGSVVEEPVVTAREKMAAIAMLDKKAREGMILGGLITRDRLTVKKKLEDGSEAEYNEEGMRLTTEASSRLKSTLALLEGASTAEGDEIIDVEPVKVKVTEERQDKNGSTKGHEPRDIRRDESGGRGSSLLPRQPIGDDRLNRSVGSQSDDGPGSDSSGGNGLCGTVHEDEWTDDGVSFPGQQGEGFGPKQDDQESTKGAGNERGAGIPVQSGRSNQDQDDGRKDSKSGREVGCDHAGDTEKYSTDVVLPRRPVVPGESGVKRTNWWEPGIPRRAPGTKPSDYRDVVTAESSLDRIKRIERAREQAAQAAAGYLERRKKNLRSGTTVPNEPGSGDGRPGTAPDPTGR